MTGSAYPEVSSDRAYCFFWPRPGRSIYALAGRGTAVLAAVLRLPAGLHLVAGGWAALQFDRLAPSGCSRHLRSVSLSFGTTVAAAIRSGRIGFCSPADQQAADPAHSQPRCREILKPPPRQAQLAKHRPVPAFPRCCE